jgi:hypothetical protein
LVSSKALWLVRCNILANSHGYNNLPQRSNTAAEAVRNVCKNPVFDVGAHARHTRVSSHRSGTACRLTRDPRYDALVK